MDGTRHATPMIAQMNEELPDDAHLDRKACSAFIEDMVQRIPPSEAQLDYAQTLAERHGVEVPQEVRPAGLFCTQQQPRT